MGLFLEEKEKPAVNIFKQVWARSREAGGRPGRARACVCSPAAVASCRRASALEQPLVCALSTTTEPQVEKKKLLSTVEKAGLLT